jgi:hypothetical protein
MTDRLVTLSDLIAAVGRVADTQAVIDQAHTDAAAAAVAATNLPAAAGNTDGGSQNGNSNADGS